VDEVAFKYGGHLTGESEQRDGLEALVQLRWEVFHGRNPGTDAVSELSIYPGVTD